MSKKWPLVGRWRITQMDLWKQDFIDAEMPGFIDTDPDISQFHFGYVHGHMDCAFYHRNGKHVLEWSWVGNDEMEPATGRGWAVLQDDGSLEGRIFIHQGDNSGFVAKKSASLARPAEDQPDQISLEIALSIWVNCE